MYNHLLHQQINKVLQQRQIDVTIPGITVDDIDQAIRTIQANGGTIAMAKFHIPTVGTGCYFHDTEGNRVGAMQYETPR